MIKGISEFDQVIDSRDVIQRIEDLELEIDDLIGDDIETVGNEIAELKALIDDLREVGEDSPEDGMTLIHEDHLTAYAREYWEDTADQEVRGIATRWPYRCIDWSQATEEFKIDYTEITFRGETFYTR